MTEMRSRRVRTPTIGSAWLGVAERILADATPGEWDGLPLREVLRVTLEIESPAPADPIVARYADAERLAWMRADFTDHARAIRHRDIVAGAAATAVS